MELHIPQCPSSLSSASWTRRFTPSGSVRKAVWTRSKSFRVYRTTSSVSAVPRLSCFLQTARACMFRTAVTTVSVRSMLLTVAALPLRTGSDGRTPRFACYNPEGTGLLVANEESDTIVSIPSGGSGPAVLVARAASPTCIAFRHGPPGKLSAPTRVMTAVSTRRPARVSIIVGIILLASAIVVAFDANRIQGGFTYGISPAAVPYVVAGFLGLLWINHFIAAFRSETAEAGPAD